MAKVYSGIWPTNLQDSQFKYDTAQEKVQFQVTFQFDHYPYTSPAINTQAQMLVSESISTLNGIISTKYADAAAPGTFTGTGIFNNED